LATSPPEVVNGDEGLAEWLKSVSA
jgi:hypothetical protein